MNTTEMIEKQTPPDTRQKILIVSSKDAAFLLRESKGDIDCYASKLYLVQDKLPELA